MTLKVWLALMILMLPMVVNPYFTVTHSFLMKLLVNLSKVQNPLKCFKKEWSIRMFFSLVEKISPRKMISIKFSLT